MRSRVRSRFASYAKKQGRCARKPRTQTHKLICTIHGAGRGGGSVVGWGAGRTGSNHGFENKAVVSTAVTNLCWDFPHFPPELEYTHKNTSEGIYADEHTHACMHAHVYISAKPLYSVCERVKAGGICFCQKARPQHTWSKTKTQNRLTQSSTKKTHTNTHLRTIRLTQAALGLVLMWPNLVQATAEAETVVTQ